MAQDCDSISLKEDELKIVTDKNPSEEELEQEENKIEDYKSKRDQE